MSSIERRFDQINPIIAPRLRRGAALVETNSQFVSNIVSKVDLMGRRLRQLEVKKIVNHQVEIKKSSIPPVLGNKPEIVLPPFKNVKQSTETRIKNESDDASISRLLERVDRAVSVMRRSGCKCGYEARQNPNAFGCKSRFCVKNRDSGQLNNIRFMRAALRRGTQRVSHARQGVVNRENSGDRSVARRAPAKAAA